jgi:hypothetical protein
MLDSADTAADMILSPRELAKLRAAQERILLLRSSVEARRPTAARRLATRTLPRDGER